jgi:hypothetical protein
MRGKTLIKEFLEEFVKRKKELIQMMWTLGDKLLAEPERKDVGPSLMGSHFVSAMDDLMAKYADGYASWMEQQAAKKPPLNDDVDASPGEVAYIAHCLQTVGGDPTDAAVIPGGEQAEWKRQQYEPLENGAVKVLSNVSPQKTPKKEDLQHSSQEPGTAQTLQVNTAQQSPRSHDRKSEDGSRKRTTPKSNGPPKKTPPSKAPQLFEQRRNERYEAQKKKLSEK